MKFNTLLDLIFHDIDILLMVLEGMSCMWFACFCERQLGLLEWINLDVTPSVVLLEASGFLSQCQRLQLSAKECCFWIIIKHPVFLRIPDSPFLLFAFLDQSRAKFRWNGHTGLCIGSAFVGKDMKIQIIIKPPCPYWDSSVLLTVIKAILR